MKKKRHVGLWVFIGLVCIFSVFPFVWMVVSSIKSTGEIMTVPPTLVPHTFTLSHYRNVFTSTNIPRFFLNSSIIASGSTALALAFALLGAYGFTRFRFRGNRFLQTVVLSSQMLPTASVIVPLFFILRILHLFNTYLGLILVYLIITLPLSVWMMGGYLRSIPVEIEEAANIDGCSRLGMLLRIVLPLSLPGLVATGIYCFVVTWNEFLFALSFATEKTVMTLPIGLAEFTSEFVTDWGGLMAASVLMTVPIVVAFFGVQRAFISGLTSGASKA